MKTTTALVLLAAAVLATGCATATPRPQTIRALDLPPVASDGWNDDGGASKRWQYLAVGATLLDIGTTGHGLSQGLSEGNPAYGRSPGVGKMVAINAASLAGTWALTRNMSPSRRAKVWRTYFLVRLAATLWNASQSGGMGMSFRF